MDDMTLAIVKNDVRDREPWPSLPSNEGRSSRSEAIGMLARRENHGDL
jgi:hypothetical protein